MKSYLTNDQKAESWDRLQEFLIESLKPVEKEPAHTSCENPQLRNPVEGIWKSMNKKEAAHTECEKDSYNLEEMAWVIISNAHGGNWSKESSEWQRAAKKWRDKYHATLNAPAPAPAPKVTLIGDLTHCPFCGSIEISHDGHISVCDICHAQGPSVFPVPDERKVFELWNRRYPNPPEQPAPKVTDEAVHTSCETCRYKADNGSFNITSAICGNCFNYERLNHSKYDPELKVTDRDRPLQETLWEDVWKLCRSLGMKVNPSSGIPEVCAFIRTLAQRAGEGYTVEQIKTWLKDFIRRDGNGNCIDLVNSCLDDAIEMLNDPQDGIKVVTKRKGGRDG